MNKELEKFLTNRANEADRKKAMQDARPKVAEQALKEYRALGTTMKSLVDKFNASALAQKTEVTLILEGPKHRTDEHLFVLHARGGKAGSKSEALLISFINTEDFDSMKMHVGHWDGNLVLSALDSHLSGYAPDEKPRRKKVEEYKVVQLDSTYVWVMDKVAPENGTPFENVFNDLVHKLVVFNMTDV